MILRESTQIQTIRITPREDVITSITLTNEATQDVLTYNIDEGFKNKFWVELNLVIDTKENNSYVLKAFNGSTEVFYTKCFCTNQTDYSINKDIYVKRESTNNFVIIE